MAADLPPAFEAYAGESVPQAAPGAAGKDGRLELAFARAGGETRLVRDFARAPYHVSGALGHTADPATVYVQSPSGGVAQGDRRSESVTVGPGATALVSTGSATKVFSMDHNYARTEVALSVEAGGHLDYVPEPTILHPDARYCRSTTVEVAADASAVVGGVVVPGRLARGEAFEFERYHGRTRIRGPEGLLAADATHLEPGGGDDTPGCDPRAPGALGDNRVFGHLFVVAPAADAAALSDAVHEAAADSDDGSDVRGVAGATALPNGAGALVRAVGPTTEPVQNRLRAGWSAARERLVGAPAPTRRK